ncbi:cytochrome b5-like heme/steroid binding domain-containing protein [Dioszegia hungarica]|uniref:Cytochrome b5-like heme/steroid binding domain-containing protein n=1 Tax=Dioszegia hungarica TaxID=4972 RepID=A0AA38HE07_9TREE|nr:cytochrome b5-like heme/steroid binding domain-containing protein [Dioszegia hungarica]KAI9638227.1 cytochrome b5-like heme/steroid binding domain-containing protein [Dioszegia hungarica]
MAQTSIMSAPAANLAPPKNDPISIADLAKHDGSDPSKPIYIAIKGRVFDVTAKKEMYGVGGGYHVFAGKDASKGLGMSSLDAKDAVADYSGLDDKQLKTLDQWESFFEKRYNVVGRVN